MPDYANLCPVHVRALTHWREDHRHESDEDHAERVEHHRSQCRACLGIGEAEGLGRERT